MTYAAVMKKHHSYYMSKNTRAKPDVVYAGLSYFTFLLRSADKTRVKLIYSNSTMFQLLNTIIKSFY